MLSFSRKSRIVTIRQSLKMLETDWVFRGRMSFLTKPAQIQEEMLDLATSSAAVKFCLCIVFSNNNDDDTRSASLGDLIVPRFRLWRSGYRAFAVSGPHVWNSLPTEIRQSCNNLLQLKSKLKTFLFQQSRVLLWFHILWGALQILYTTTTTTTTTTCDDSQWRI